MAFVFTKPSKDGPLPTEFIFEGLDTAFELLGKTEESKTVTAFDPVFEMDLSWFEGKATFRQKIRLLQRAWDSLERSIFKPVTIKYVFLEANPFALFWIPQNPLQ